MLFALLINVAVKITEPPVGVPAPRPEGTLSVAVADHLVPYGVVAGLGAVSAIWVAARLTVRTWLPWLAIKSPLGSLPP